jgi:hypothetical protein
MSPCERSAAELRCRAALPLPRAGFIASSLLPCTPPPTFCRSGQKRGEPAANTAPDATVAAAVVAPGEPPAKRSRSEGGEEATAVPPQV